MVFMRGDAVSNENLNIHIILDQSNAHDTGTYFFIEVQTINCVSKLLTLQCTFSFHMAGAIFV